MNKSEIPKSDKCIVPNCPNARGSNCANMAMHFFRFPTEPSRAQAWRDALKLSVEEASRYRRAKVCNLHFAEEDINRSFFKASLNRNAVPMTIDFMDILQNQNKVDGVILPNGNIIQSPPCNITKPKTKRSLTSLKLKNVRRKLVRAKTLLKSKDDLIAELMKENRKLKQIERQREQAKQKRIENKLKKEAEKEEKKLNKMQIKNGTKNQDKKSNEVQNKKRNKNQDKKLNEIQNKKSNEIQIEIENKNQDKEQNETENKIENTNRCKKQKISNKLQNESQDNKQIEDLNEEQSETENKISEVIEKLLKEPDSEISKSDCKE